MVKAISLSYATPTPKIGMIKESNWFDWNVFGVLNRPYSFFVYIGGGLDPLLGDS
jgi:hypothetical protein